MNFTSLFCVPSVGSLFPSGFNSVMATQLTKFWGKLTPALAVQQVLPIVQTGSLHAYVADLPNMQWYISFAASQNSTDVAKMAYDRLAVCE
jgi:hypothetical protein